MCMMLEYVFVCVRTNCCFQEADSILNVLHCKANKAIAANDEVFRDIILFRLVSFRSSHENHLRILMAYIDLAGRLQSHPLVVEGVYMFACVRSRNWKFSALQWLTFTIAIVSMAQAPVFVFEFILSPFMAKASCKMFCVGRDWLGLA